MRKTNLKIKIGCDPELFAFDTETGQPVSVHEIIPGSKENPFNVPRGAIQVDGVAAEFNIVPAENIHSFLASIERVKGILDLVLSHANPKFKFLITPTATFNKEYFDSLPFHVKQLGCQPDYNAYTGKENPKPSTNKPMRTAAGHIHIGWTANEKEFSTGTHFKHCCDLTQELDFVLYNSSLLWDKDDERRELYGKPGSFRPKPYGMEYRVLSNKWLETKNLQKFVYSASKAVALKFFKGHEIKDRFNHQNRELKGNERWVHFSRFLIDNNIPSPLYFT